MNLKIAFTALIGIFLAIIIFYGIMNWYPSNFDQIYLWSEYIKNETNKPKIFLFGSSHTGNLDTNYIQEYLKNNKIEHEVYNLAISSDYPTRRAETIGYISELKPEIIFYGIEIRMFEGQPDMTKEQLTALEITQIEGITPNPSEIFEDLLFPLYNNDFFSKIPKSPKIITLKTIKHFIHNSNETTTLDFKSNEPFYNIEKGVSPVVDLEVLQKDWNKQDRKFYGIDPQKNREFNTLKEIIKELENKDIKVVIFATPKSSVYLNWLETEDKLIFEQMLKELEKPGTAVYSEYNQYADDNIWTSVDHVVQSDLGIIYSQDTAKMIIKEIKK